MLRRLWPGLAVLLVLVGGYFGWRSYQHLLQYRAEAHSHFVAQFGNGVRGAYTNVEEARRVLSSGNAPLAAVRLTAVSGDLQMMQNGARGMFLGGSGNPWELRVMARYQQEILMLQDDLLKGVPNSGVQQRLDNLAHDLTVLVRLVGDNQDDWLRHATRAELNAKYQSWREQALIKPDTP